MYGWVVGGILGVLAVVYIYAQVRSRECLPSGCYHDCWISCGKPNFSKPMIGWLVSFKRVVYFTDYTTDKMPFGKWIMYLRLQHFVSGYAQQVQAVTAGHRTWITYKIVVVAEPEARLLPGNFSVEPGNFEHVANCVAEQVHKALQYYVDGGDKVEDRLLKVLAEGIEAIEPRDPGKWNIESILRSSNIDNPYGLKVEIQKPTPIPLPRIQPNFVL